MKKVIKKIICMILCFAMIFTTLQTTMFSASAKVVGPDNKTELTITTDKSKYSWGDTIVFNIDVKNVSNETLTGIRISSLARNYMKLVEDGDAPVISKLEPGETTTVQVKYFATKLVGAMAFFFPIIWLFSPAARILYRETPFNYEKKVKVGAIKYRIGFEVEYNVEQKVELSTVSIESTYGGNVSTRGGKFSVGTVISLSAVPFEGWHFLKWESTNGGEFTNSNLANSEYTVPANDTSIIGIFKKNSQDDATEDDYIVYNAFYGLTVKYSEGDYAESVTNNIVLPNSYNVSGKTVNVRWLSSNDSVISFDGKVVRPNDVDASIVLTAKLSRGNTAVEKLFNITVKKVNNTSYNDIKNNTIIDLEKMNKSSNESSDLEVEYSEDGERLSFISGVFSDIKVDSIETALQSIYSVRSLIGISSPKDDLKWIATNHDGMSLAYSFNQQHKGIPVYGVNITVSANEDTGTVQSISSSAFSEEMLSTIDITPDITADEAKQINSINVYGTDCLIIYCLDEYRKEPVLAYLIETSDTIYVINAKNGSVISHWSNHMNWGDYSTTGYGKDELNNNVTFPVQFHQWDFWFYYQEDVERNIQVKGNSESAITKEFNTEWKDTTANSAYTNVIKTYDWYKNHLNRISIDNSGMKIIINVHDSSMTDNAYWSSTSEQIYFCENTNGGTPTTAAGLDIIAHELTHGVFEKIVGTPLKYENFTGSINEGYADVFGLFVDSDDWTIGEDWNEIRDAANPARHNAPTRLNGSNYYTGTNQSTLVHTNSSLVYHAMYLMHSYGIARNQLEKIWYNSISLGYDANSTFNTVRRNLIQAAKNNNLSDEEIAKVRKAFDEEAIYGETGKIKITFTDISGNKIPVSDLLPTDFNMNRNRFDVPKTEYSNVGFNDDGAINIERIYFGIYNTVIKIPQYIPFEAQIEITKGKTTELVVPLIKSGEGKATGVITSATTGRTIENVELVLFKGWNQRLGNVVALSHSDANGNYSFKIPAGYYTMKMSKDGYTTGYYNLKINGGETLPNQNVSISPIMTLGSNYRVVLTWGATPSDLDSHLFGQSADGTNYHVYYSNENGCNKSGIVANLDVDDTTSYGPETTTFIVDTEGSYEYYVDWFSGSGSWGTSGGKVEVYNEDILIYVFDVPNINNQSGSWKVFTYKNGIFTPFNIIQSQDIY